MICKKYGTYCTEMDCYYCKYCVYIADRGQTWESMCGYDRDEEESRTQERRKLLEMRLDLCDLSVRTHNCLKAAEIHTLGDLVKNRVQDLLSYRNFSRKTISELTEFISEHGFYWGYEDDEQL